MLNECGDQPACEVAESACYILWSGKHKAWWRPMALGYTQYREEAGRFTRDEAVEYIVRSAASGDPELVTRMVHD